jgi:uncharacterized membrane protein YdjX (TVP38/TMEM64 family)
LLWVSEYKIGGPFLISLITAGIVILVLPYTVVAVGSGYIYTQVYQDNLAVALSIGTASCFMGAWIGAIIAFLIGRYIFRKKI